MDHSMSGKVALVTGGTSGIGQATAIAFGRAGASVVVAGRSEAGGGRTVAEIERAGGKALFVRTDVTRDADVRGMVDAAVRTFGRLDYAFNNAGVEEPVGVLTEKTEAQYEQIFDVNVRGVFLSMKHEIPALLATGGGAIVNNASVAGVVGLTGVALYVASKHAVVGMSRTAALEYSKRGVRVNVVAPAAVDTPMLDRFVGADGKQGMTALHPIGRLGEPADVAAAVVWLCSPAASFVTGHTLMVDGGWTAQ